MMSWIKEKILWLYTKRLIKTRRATRMHVGFRQAQHIGILYSAGNPQKQQVVRQLAKQLQKMGKQVTGLCYATIPMQQTANDFPTVTQHDLHYWGTITHPQAQAFVNTPFDYLFQVDLMGHPILNYLLAKSQAQCRIGYYDPTRTNLFEIMVMFERKDDKEVMTALVEQMIHYAQLIKVR